uniref:Fmp27_GFWDK domain-containing protein n=1 Tax=Globodera pallida TaxID=36090 RepID=A0A183BWJ3_GLOPA
MFERIKWNLGSTDKFGMRHLAVRFVRQTNLARIATNDYPLVALNSHIHVVDPQLALRDRFQGEKAIELSRSILARKLLHSVDLLRIRNDYDLWWEAFKTFSRLRVEKTPLEKRHIRSNLLDSSAGLLSVLKLPNDLDRDGPSTSELNRCEWHSVQFRRFILSALQRLIFAIVQPKPQLVSFPQLVRPAVVEACNLELDLFPLVVESDSYLSLTGVDLPSLISPLIKCQLSCKSNPWPLVLVTSGNVYPPTVSAQSENNSGLFGQKAQLSLLIMDDDWHKCSEMCQHLTYSLSAFLARIGLSFSTADVKPPHLFLYERSALTFSHESSVEFARFSNIGDYLLKVVAKNARFLCGFVGGILLGFGVA